MNREAVRMLLASQDQDDFDKINDQKILGASQHIAMIGRMIENIALDYNDSVDTLLHRVKSVGDFFIETRGEASQAVSNAISIMLRGLDALSSNTDVKQVAERIIEAKDDYKVYSEKALSMCVEYGFALLKNKKKIFIYDYSSTVDKVLAKLADSEMKHHVYIAESRIIDGGKPFLKTCLDSGHLITFFPDSAMMYFLKQADVALMGAETFYPDGTGFNTTGSDIVGLVCKTHHIPLYFITPLIKLDARPLAGKEKNLVFNDTKVKLSKNLMDVVDVDKIQFVVPELLGVPADQITGFITEQGVIPSVSMFDVSIKYLDFINGGSYES